MTNHTIIFSAKRQELRVTNGFARFASDTINYIYARFELDDEWQEFDVVKAVWQNDECKISQLITHNTEAAVPIEMLSRRSLVTVNLVGYTVEDEELTERLTTYPVKALIVDKTAIVEGDESSGVSPSLFDQYIEIVATEVGRVTDMTVSAHSSDTATVDKSEVSGVVHLAFGLPKGDKGDAGSPGQPGAPGPQGPPGSGDENVQSDWAETDTTSDAYIKNKPTIPTVPTNISAFTNDAGYLTSYTETDPVFTASAAHDITSSDISSWSGKSTVSIDRKTSSGTNIADITINGTTTQLYAPSSSGGTLTDVTVDGVSVVSGGVAAIDLTGKADVGDVPASLSDLTNDMVVSDFTNDAGYLTSYTETDPTVPSWAKASSKPSYTASEVGAVPTTRTVNGKALSSDISLTASDVSALPSSTTIPSKVSDLTNDSGFLTLATLPIYNGGVS